MRPLGTISYALSCQYAVLEARKGMTKESEQSYGTTLSLALGLTSVLLMGMSLAGYLPFGDAVKSNIFANLEATSTPVRVGLFAECIHLMLVIPNEFLIMRLFAASIFNTDADTMPTSSYVGVTLGLFLGPMILMACTPERDVLGVFSFVLHLTGDIPTGVFSFFLPAVLYLSMFKPGCATGDTEWWGTVAIGVLGVFLTFFMPLLHITEFAHACNSAKGCGSY